MLGFIDTMRAEGHAVESICRVLREQGYQIAARTYRAHLPRPAKRRRGRDRFQRRDRSGDARSGLSGVRRDKGIRTTIPAKDGIRAGDLLNRDFTAPRSRPIGQGTRRNQMLSR